MAETPGLRGSTTLRVDLSSFSTVASNVGPVSGVNIIRGENPLPGGRKDGQNASDNSQLADIAIPMELSSSHSIDAMSTQNVDRNNPVVTEALEIPTDSLSGISHHFSQMPDVSSLQSEISHHSTSPSDTLGAPLGEDTARVLGDNPLAYSELDINANTASEQSLTIGSTASINSPMKRRRQESSIYNENEPSSPESNVIEMMSADDITQDEVTSRLARSGPVGLAAAVAVASARKRKSQFQFESNPALRRRYTTKLMRQLQNTIDEYTTRVGVQAAVVIYTPGKDMPMFKVFGANPLESVLKKQKHLIIREVESSLQSQTPTSFPPATEQSLFELPPLVFEGIPTPVSKMTQAQLRNFIPTMLKYSTHRGKPGWGKEDNKPPWWPEGIPFENIRIDPRSPEEKKQLSWTDALRQIIVNCYVHHGRLDLLPEFSQAQQMQQQQQIQQQQQNEETSQANVSDSKTDNSGGVISTSASHSQPPSLLNTNNQQVFTIDTGMGSTEEGNNSGMATLADASLAETAAKLQQIADETGQVQYATQTVTVTERDAKALGQPVGSTTTVLLTAYPGGQGTNAPQSDGSQQFLNSVSSSVDNQYLSASDTSPEYLNLGSQPSESQQYLNTSTTTNAILNSISNTTSDQVDSSKDTRNLVESVVSALSSTDKPSLVEQIRISGLTGSAFSDAFSSLSEQAHSVTDHLSQSDIALASQFISGTSQSMSSVQEEQ